MTNVIKNTPKSVVHAVIWQGGIAVIIL
jgi:hypothetical protein